MIKRVVAGRPPYVEPDPLGLAELPQQADLQGERRVLFLAVGARSHQLPRVVGRELVDEQVQVLTGTQLAFEIVAGRAARRACR